MLHTTFRPSVPACTSPPSSNANSCATIRLVTRSPRLSSKHWWHRARSNATLDQQQRLMGLHTDRHGNCIQQFITWPVVHGIPLHHLSHRRGREDASNSLQLRHTLHIVLTFFARVASCSPLWTTTPTAIGAYCAAT